jgi:hypothetical protein
MSWIAVLGLAFTADALLTLVYIILENRRAQGTLAWMLLCLTLPGIGPVIYPLADSDSDNVFRPAITRDLGRSQPRMNSWPSRH